MMPRAQLVTGAARPVAHGWSPHQLERQRARRHHPEWRGEQSERARVARAWVNFFLHGQWLLNRIARHAAHGSITSTTADVTFMSPLPYPPRTNTRHTCCTYVHFCSATMRSFAVLFPGQSILASWLTGWALPARQHHIDLMFTDPADAGYPDIIAARDFERAQMRRWVAEKRAAQVARSQPPQGSHA